MRIHGGRYLTETDLADLGVGAVGAHVRVHETCVIVGLEAMRFGSNVRVDPFAVLTAAGGTLTVGDFVHLSSHLFLSAGAGVEIGDFVALSVGVKLFSRSDDYSGEYLTNPTVPAEYTAPPPASPVRIGRHVIVGAGAVILPEVELGEGAAVGANSLVSRSLEPWGIYAGTPAARVRERGSGLLAHEASLRAALAAGTAISPVTKL